MTPIDQQAYCAAVAAFENHYGIPFTGLQDRDIDWVKEEQARLLELYTRSIPTPQYVEEQQLRGERANPTP